MSGDSSKLYTLQVLALATSLAKWPLDPGMPFQGRARSPSCGSALSLSLALDKGGLIVAIGVAAQACAVGQASAALFAQAATGRSRDQIAAACTAIELWQLGSGTLPDWPGLGTLAAARDYPARHGAMLLAWRASLDALP